MNQKKILRAAKYLEQFTNKHGTKIAMLVPLLAFLFFFSYSTISALITVKSAQLPKNFKKIKFKIKDYFVEHLDENSQEKLWNLKAKSAIVNSKYSKAEIIDPVIEYFEKGTNKTKFLLSAKHAKLDKKIQSFDLTKDVKLNYENDSFLLNSGKLKFSDASNLFKVSKTWSLNSPSQDIFISAREGEISKDFQSIKSIGSAKLEKGQYQLSADKINIEISPERQIVDSYGASKLMIPEKNILLTASEIHLDAKGNLRAIGKVNISTDSANCFAEKLCVRTESKTQIARLIGNPYILRNNDKIYADEIIYNFDTEELTIKGNVHS